MPDRATPEVRHTEWPPRFQMASKCWPGTAKLAEECNELAQVIMKIIGTAGTMEFADGQMVDPERLIEEMGDVEAALEMVKRYSLNYDQRQRVISRRIGKIGLFESWRTIELHRFVEVTLSTFGGSRITSVLEDSLHDDGTFKVPENCCLRLPPELTSDKP